jgi:protein O-GlcNAc transferase
MDAAATESDARVLYTACPLCDSAEFSEIERADCTGHALYDPRLPPTMRWNECAACKHVFTDGYFTADALRILFSRTQDVQKPGTELERQRHLWAIVVSNVARYVKEGNWLDVGFGSGSLMFTAEEFGYRIAGIDLRESSVAAMRELGFEAHCTDIETLKAPGRVSVISMADVLEHMPFPRRGLAAARDLLRPGGVLFVSMPNAGAYVFRALTRQKANPYWSEIEHYHNFSRDRLYRLLREAGFEPVEYGVSPRYRVCMEVISIRK